MPWSVDALRSDVRLPSRAVVVVPPPKAMSVRDRLRPRAGASSAAASRRRRAAAAAAAPVPAAGNLRASGLAGGAGRAAGSPPSAPSTQAAAASMPNAASGPAFFFFRFLPFFATGARLDRLDPLRRLPSSSAAATAAARSPRSPAAAAGSSAPPQADTGTLAPTCSDPSVWPRSTRTSDASVASRRRTYSATVRVGSQRWLLWRAVVSRTVDVSPGPALAASSASWASSSLRITWSSPTSKASAPARSSTATTEPPDSSTKSTSFSFVGSSVSTALDGIFSNQSKPSRDRHMFRSRTWNELWVFDGFWCRAAGWALCTAAAVIVS